MKPVGRKNRLLRWIISLVVIGTALFIGGRFFLYQQIRKAIDGQFADLQRKGIYIKYDHMDFNVVTGKLVFYQLSVDVGNDSITWLSCKVPFLLLKGISAIPFVKDKTLSIGSVLLEEAKISYTLGAKLLNNDTSTGFKVVLQNIVVNEIGLPGASLSLQDSAARDTVMHVRGDILVRDVGFERQIDSLAWREGEVNINKIVLELPKEFYKAKIENAKIDLKGKSLDIDSIKVSPMFGRRKYMRVMGKEIDHISGLVTNLKIRGVNWLTYPAPRLEISKILLQLNLQVFRDKRYPFLKTKTTVLPSNFIHGLPFQLSIDSIRLLDSYVSYEEYPASGDSTGIVVFDKLFATVTNIHNNPDLPEPIKMQAYSKFMGAGDLNVNFTFPHQPNQPNYLSGSLQDFPLESLNRMLGAAAKVKVESGIMRNLKFNVTYTMLKSSGQVELNYSGLKVLSLRENKDQKQAISPVKTLLLNAFIIKKDLDENDEKGERTGTVEFYRDTRRSIFNYWWKSVFSGIKSAYKLDKLPIKNSRGQKQPDHKKKKNSRDS